MRTQVLSLNSYMAPSTGPSTIDWLRNPIKTLNLSVPFS